MNRVIILGQAPSRVGDGRPFSGPSGRRLCSLTGLADYDELSRAFKLMNLLREPVKKVPGKKGDLFDRKMAAARGAELYEVLPDEFKIVCCGREVWRSMGLDPTVPYFQWANVKANRRAWGDLVLFPHPSGISHYWNDAGRVRRAAEFLAPLAHRGRIAEAP